MSLLRTGLCSVTMRHLSTDQVIRLAAAAGLHGVEWGADVHAPPGNGLADLAARTRAAGLAASSYGTYWRATPGDPGHDVLRAARALGCRRLRVWAGTTSSADASPGERAAVSGRVQQLADLAAEDGLELAFEHHDGTLADTVSSTLELLAAVDRANVGTYWQPRVGEPADVAVAGLADLLPHVRAVHVFSWWPGLERLRLEERSELWTTAIELLASTGRPLDLLLEFLPDDDESLLSQEADRLRTWIARCGGPLTS